ncbi:MAG TPA: hypothetical protein VI387_13540, partial [Candidatus Brocadiales bacterium]|nr:hypothetical protein [Candidatus Brocadiales bacterium]
MELGKKEVLKKRIGIEDYPQVEINFSPKIPSLKKIPDKSKVNLRYSLIMPFAFAHIYWDNKISELVYEVEEPYLTDLEKKHKEELITAMENMINLGEIIEKDQDLILKYIDRMMKILAVELGIDLPYESYRKIYYY